jgi:hypothetical protein
MEAWIHGQYLFSAPQISPGAGCHIPHLRKGVATCRVINVTRNRENVTVGERGVGRVPTAGVHIGDLSPRVRERIVNARVLEANTVGDVSPGY